jgi:deazaflavin-dependent oxidoreductase (nitroreductase family)
MMGREKANTHKPLSGLLAKAYLNLEANPRASVQLGDETRLMIARTAEGDERTTLWLRAVKDYPAYDQYQQKTDRKIPVVILHPATLPKESSSPCVSG